MTLTPKESSLLKDLQSQEELCVEKYRKYSQQACDAQLKTLFDQIGQTETQHLQTLQQIASGTVPAMNQQKAQQQNTTQETACDQAAWQKDSYLCSDALSTEKHVSSEYDTCIFEFTNPQVRDALNHIQKEEQQHGLQIYQYMSQNNMYA